MRILKKITFKIYLSDHNPDLSEVFLLMILTTPQPLVAVVMLYAMYWPDLSLATT